MRIAFLTHEPFYPPSGGGSCEAVYLIQSMRKAGHEVEVFSPQIEDSRKVEEKFGIKIHPFQTFQLDRYTSFRNLKYLIYPFFQEREVRAFIKANPVDLIFSQHAISAVTAGRLKKKLRIPTVMNFLDHLTGFMETWPAWIAPRSLISSLKRFEMSIPSRYEADGVLTVSDELADRFRKTGYPREKLLPIYFGIDRDQFSQVKLNPESKPSPPVIMMHGSFDKHHLGATATEAVKVVHKEMPEARFRFVGRRTPVLNRFVRQLKQKMPELTIECPGFIPYNRIVEQLNEASLGMVPYQESSGTHCAFIAKAVEYLAAGIPVVCTPLEGLRSYFQDEPLIRFSSFDGCQFGEDLLYWLKMPTSERIPLQKEAAAKIWTELDWKVICDRGVEFCEKIHSSSTA